MLLEPNQNGHCRAVSIIQPRQALTAATTSFNSLTISLDSRLDRWRPAIVDTEFYSGGQHGTRADNPSRVV